MCGGFSGFGSGWVALYIWRLDWLAGVDVVRFGDGKRGYTPSWWKTKIVFHSPNMMELISTPSADKVLCTVLQPPPKASLPFQSTASRRHRTGVETQPFSVAPSKVVNASIWLSQLHRPTAHLSTFIESKRLSIYKYTRTSMRREISTPNATKQSNHSSTRSHPTLPSGQHPQSYNIALPSSLVSATPTSRREIARLRREIPPLRQRRNSTQQKLQLSIRRTRRILRHHMPTKPNLHKRQTTLSMRSAKDARASQRRRAQLAMIRDEEVVPGGVAEALRVVPGHILNHKQSPIGEEDVVEEAVGDDDVVSAFDDGGEDGEARGRGGIGGVDEDVCGGAFLPVGVGRGVDGALHVAAVEVDACAGGQVVEGAGEAEHVPEEGAGGGDLVDVDCAFWLAVGKARGLCLRRLTAGVDEDGGVVDVGPEVAAGEGGVGRVG